MTQLATLAIEGLRRDESLAKYTAARLGGAADWFYLARHTDAIDDLIEVVMAAWDDGMPVRVIGGGANILISDVGFRGLVIVNHIADVQFADWHERRNVSATAGTNLITLARLCQRQGLSGMEWAIGVPGTVGGAIVNNAGAHGTELADVLADVVVLEERGPKLYSCADMDFAYRHSVLKARADRRFLVLMATLRLSPGNPAAIEATMQEYNQYRKRTQPPGASLGSIFKNPEGDYAGRLIEACGLKGYEIGGVQVSPIHANFFVNTGKATASDYYALIHHVQHKVFQQTTIHLELEIELVGEWDKHGLPDSDE